tara:strand:+ start:10653 stop:13835 length:3183 start_codon:yes stop_codon:yes gene_type:complete
MGFFDFLKGEETANVDNINLLQAATKELRQYYATQGRPDLVTTMLAERTKAGAEDDPDAEIEVTMSEGEVGVSRDIVDNLTFMILDNSEGAYFTKDFIRQTQLLSRFEVNSTTVVLPSDKYAGIENFVKIYYDSSLDVGTGGAANLDDLFFYINKDPKDGTSPIDIKSIAVPPAPAGSSGFEVNKDPLSPERFSTPSLACFTFPNNNLSPAARLTGPAALFLNAIPTVEISRCIPFIKVTFISAAPPLLGEKTDLSILNFLGSSNSDADGVNMTDALPQMLKEEFGFTLVTQADDGAEVKQYSTSISAAGMELFTSPQTMVDANINGTSRTSKGGSSFLGDHPYASGESGILNPFAPLMSLEKISINVTGLKNEMLTNETANMSFVIHDRSRMAELAPLLAADLFGSTYLTIEYGWSHPDGVDASGNSYGALLNSMRSVGAYNIVATNFGIANDGQVRCDMRLTNRGGSEVKIFPIATGNLMPVAVFESMITGYLAQKLQADTAGMNASQSKEIRSKAKVSMDAATSPSTVVSRDIYSKFAEILKPRQEGTVQSSSELVEAIKALVGDPAKAGTSDALGEIATSNVSLAKEVENKLNHMMTGKDPWLKSVYPPSVVESLKAAKQTGAAVSLGKLLATFVGAPMAGSGRFDEVQLMMYRFNQQSGAARDYESIANFNISSEYLRMLVKEFVSVKPSMSIQGFIGFINDKLLSSPNNPNYGLTAEQDKLSETSSGEGQTQEAIQTVASEMNKKLKEIYQNSDSPARAQFRVPKLSMYLECLPAMVKSDEGDPSSSFVQSPDKNILRIHVYDLKATPYEDELFLLAAQNDKDTAEVIKPTAPAASTEATSANGAGESPAGASSGTADNAIGDGATGAVVPAAPPDDKASGASDSPYIVYTASVSNKKIKSLIKSAVPSITYGEGFSAMNSFNMRSTTSGPVADAMMVNARLEGAKSPTDSKNTASTLEDVTVIPANASMDLLGCPILRYGQHFFIDLGTGTTADNLYYITGIEHNLSAGEFSTNVSLGFAGTGQINSFRAKLESAIPGLSVQAEEEKKASDVE